MKKDVETYLLLLALLLLLLLLTFLLLLTLHSELALGLLFRRRLNHLLDGLGLLSSENIVIVEVTLLGLLASQIDGALGIGTLSVFTLDKVVGLALLSLLGLIFSQSSHKAADWRSLLVGIFLGLLIGGSSGGSGLAEISLPVLLLSLVSLLLGRHCNRFPLGGLLTIRFEW